LPILRQIGVVMGDDLAWLSLDANAHLAAGYWGTVRIQFDRLLLREPDNSQAYLGHALASAHIGALAREKDDLVVAATLDPAGTAQFHQQHDAELQAAENSMPKEDAKTLTQPFIAAAKSGEDDEKLAQRALRLRYAVNAVRRVPQEKYIDGYRRRLNAIKANPKDAAGWADLATFIYREAPNKFGEGKSDGIDWESDRVDAMFYSNRALSLDPNNIEAISTKGWLLEQDNQEKDALTLAQNGLRLVPGYPRLANLQGELLQVSALRAQQQAGNLRSVKSGMILTPDAIITWSRPPSQAELDAARGYDAMSSANLATANHDLLTGWRQFSDSVEQMDVIADYLDYHGQQQQAIDLYKKVLSLDPRNETALMQLEDICKNNKQVDDAFELQFRLDNVFATSADAMVDKAASDEDAHDLAAAKADLDRALAADPSDAKVYVQMAHLNSNTDAAAWDVYTRCAVAMSEAQMRINHESFVAGTPGSLAPADAQLMIMLLKNRAHYLQQNNRSAADAVNRELTDINRRVALSKVYDGAQDSQPAWQTARLQWEKQLIANNEMAQAARFCLEIPNRAGAWHSESGNEAYQLEYPVYRYLAPKLYHFQLWHFFGPGTLQNYEAWATSGHSTDTGLPPVNIHPNMAE
jgi:Tfp pilus assembly protein PilF